MENCTLNIDLFHKIDLFIYLSLSSIFCFFPIDIRFFYSLSEIHPVIEDLQVTNADFM